MKKLVVGIGLCVVLAAAGYWMFHKKDRAPAWRTAPVTRGDIVETVNASGTITPVITVQVGTQVSGRVLELFADFNSAVRKGQAIARIDPAPFQAQMEQAQASRGVALANLEKAEAQALEAERIFRRTRELFAQEVASLNDLDAAETGLTAARAQVSVSRAQLVQTEASLRLARTNLDYTTIVSPVDGLVVSRDVDVGQTVAASFQTPTLFTIAEDLTRMQILASVDEADIGRVKEGQPVSFTVDAYPDREFTGAVTQVRNAAVTLQNVVTYTVVVEVDNADLRLKPGMTANVAFETAVARDALRVPSAALRVRMGLSGNGESGKRGSGEAGKPGSGEAGEARKEMARPPAGGPKPSGRASAVWVVEGGKPRSVTVFLGLSDGVYTEVVSPDLREGMKVIVESPGARSASRPGSPSPRFP